MAVSQQRLFPLAVDESKLGPNQRDVLKRIDRHGSIGVRHAGRVVYANRGRNPDRIEKDFLRSAGFRVLISLKQRGLVRSRPDGYWIRTRPNPRAVLAKAAA